MRTCAAMTRSRAFRAAIAAVAILAAPSVFGPAEANPGIKRVPANAGADSGSAATASAASAQTASKPKDPLSQLKFSDSARAHQERANRILAENGEAREGEDPEAVFATDQAPQTPVSAAKPAKTKPAAPRMQCLAGCD